MKRLIYIVLAMLITAASGWCQQPPMLLFPTPQMRLTQSNPMFLWQASGPGAEYHFVLVERLSHQSASVALQSNPPLYQEQNLQQTFLVYPLTAPPLVSGTSYAWQVTAYIDQVDAPPLQAVSEAREFDFDPPAQQHQHDDDEDDEEEEEEQEFTYAHLHLDRPNVLYEFSGDTLAIHYNEEYSAENTLRILIQDTETGDWDSTYTLSPLGLDMGLNNVHLYVGHLYPEVVYYLEAMDYVLGRQYLKFRIREEE